MSPSSEKVYVRDGPVMAFAFAAKGKRLRVVQKDLTIVRRDGNRALRLVRAKLDITDPRVWMRCEGVFLLWARRIEEPIQGDGSA